MITTMLYHRLEAVSRHKAPQEACGVLFYRSRSSSDTASSDVPGSDVPGSDVPGSDVPSSDVPSSDVHGRWDFCAMRNLSCTPERDFAMSQIKIDMLRAQCEKLILFHSHPHGPAYPSYADMRSFLAGPDDWLIADISGKMAEFFTLTHAKSPALSPDFGVSEHVRPDLHDRGFRHGVTDCYSLIRDYYHQYFGIDLPDFARDWHWWSQGKSMYRDNFTAAQFTALEPGTPLQAGDICLMRIRSEVANHAAIWLGDGRIFHHLAGRAGYDPQRLPQYDPAERFQPFIETWLRHETLQGHQNLKNKESPLC